jgi:hypothetical protein
MVLCCSTWENMNSSLKTRVSSKAFSLWTLIAVLLFAFCTPSSNAVASSYKNTSSLENPELATATRVSTRAGLLATALDEMAIKAMQRGVGSMDELAVAFRGTDAAIANVLESAGKCDLCLTRVESSIQGLKTELGLTNKQALEWMAEKAQKYSNGNKSRVDDFMFSVLDVCVGSSPTPERLQRCEKLFNLDFSNCLRSGNFNVPKIPAARPQAIYIACNELLPVPSVRNGEFNTWFNSLTEDEIWALWSNKAARSTIERRLRHPGGLHEWFMVAEAPTFKSWGFTVEDIRAIRTEISKIRLVEPVGSHVGTEGYWMHQQIQEIIRNSVSYEQFKRGINTWAQYRLPNGVNDLPEALRLR